MQPRVIHKLRAIFETSLVPVILHASELTRVDFRDGNDQYSIDISTEKPKEIIKFRAIKFENDAAGNRRKMDKFSRTLHAMTTTCLVSTGIIVTKCRTRISTGRICF